MYIDLQLHSTYSDGYITPTELAKFMHHQGVKVTSLTDHNTVRGLPEFERACQKYRIKTIPGIELYVTLGNRKLNVLWFNFKDDPKFHSLLRDSQIRRRNKARIVLEKLAQSGFIINIEKTLDQFNYYIPINRLIGEILKIPANRRIVQKKLNSRVFRTEEVIKEFFKNKKMVIFHESYINLHRLIRLRKNLGGQIVINHPGRHNLLKREFLAKAKQAGVDGLEVISPHHSIGSTMYAQYMSREFNFLETGGSDFHLFEGNNYPIQHSWQYCKIDSTYLKGIEKIIS
jgi:3',5'-nucleoside bisphosphate phosphatase